MLLVGWIGCCGGLWVCSVLLVSAVIMLCLIELYMRMLRMLRLGIDMLRWPLLGVRLVLLQLLGIGILWLLRLRSVYLGGRSAVCLSGVHDSLLHMRWRVLKVLRIIVYGRLYVGEFLAWRGHSWASSALLVRGSCSSQTRRLLESAWRWLVRGWGMYGWRLLEGLLIGERPS